MTDYLRMGDTVSGPGVFNVKTYGAKGDGVTDDITAFETAINIMSVLPAIEGATLYIPPGTYKLSRTWYINRSIDLRGAHGGVFASSILSFAAGAPGIVFEHVGQGIGGGGADFSYCADIRVIGNGGATSNGITTFSPVHFERVTVAGFSGHGFFIQGELPDSSSSLFRLDNCQATSNTLHGFYINGPDANAGVIICCSARDNGGVGFYDSSFLGNTYIGCHTDANLTGAYVTDDPSAVNCFVGCYSEGNQVQNIIHPSLVLGGLMAAPDSGTANTRQAQLSSHLAIETNTIGALGGIDKEYLMQLGSAYGGEHIYLGWGSHLFPSTLLKFGNQVPTTWRPSIAAEPWTGMWTSIGNPESDESHQTLIAMPCAPGYAVIPGHYVHPTRMAPGGQFAFRDLLLGDYLNGTNGGWGRKITTGKLALGSENGVPWHGGDVIFNASPDIDVHSQQVAGWICAIKGTGGTYTEGLTATWLGSGTVQLSGATTVLHPGMNITIDGVTATIARIDATTNIIYLWEAISVSGGAHPITYTAPTWIEIATKVKAGAAPTTGTYSVGDVVYNTIPAAGGSIGWVCVTAGTPGTWKEFGLISL